jgi:hypothetical protein
MQGRQGLGFPHRHITALATTRNHGDPRIHTLRRRQRQQTTAAEDFIVRVRRQHQQRLHGQRLQALVGHEFGFGNERPAGRHVMAFR